MTESSVQRPLPVDEGRGCVTAVGVALLLLALLTLGLATLVVFAAFAVQTHDPAGNSSLVTATSSLFYVAIAALLFTLALNTMRPRRWARALAVALFGLITLLGCSAVASFFAMAPMMQQQMPDEATAKFAFGCGAAMLLIFFVAVPLALFLFYRSARTRRVFERADPVARWTDEIPPLVLAIAAWMLLMSFGFLLSSTYGVIALGGDRFLSGAGAVAIFIAVGLAGLAIAIGTALRKRAAWYGALAASILLLVYAAAVFPTIDLDAMYESMGMPMPAGMDAGAMYQSPIFIGNMLGLWILFVIALFVSRKYFFGAGREAASFSPRESDRE